MKSLPEIPGFRIIKEIGQGAVARVYLAWQRTPRQRVALKVIIPEQLHNRKVISRFLKEANIAAQLVHPNIVRIFHVGVYPPFHYMAMEYLAGGNLIERRQRKGRRVKPELALAIVRQVGMALAYAHERGVIHRDIKPENILFRRDGTPVIVDFGIARIMDRRSSITTTGMSIGTPPYMSPEQCRGEAVDGRSDVYSLGVVLFEMLTGQKPYDAENLVGVMVKHIQDAVPRLPPGGLERYQGLIDRMMAKTKAERLETGQELFDLIDAARSPEQGRADPQKTQPVPAQTAPWKVKAVSPGGSRFMRPASLVDSPGGSHLMRPASPLDRPALIWFRYPVVLALALAGYFFLEKTESGGWIKASWINAYDGFVEYIQKYPAGRHLEEAVEKLTTNPDYLPDGVRFIVNHFPLLLLLAVIVTLLAMVVRRLRLSKSSTGNSRYGKPE